MFTSISSIHLLIILCAWITWPNGGKRGLKVGTSFHDRSRHSSFLLTSGAVDLIDGVMMVRPVRDNGRNISDGLLSSGLFVQIITNWELPTQRQVIDPHGSLTAYRDREMGWQRDPWKMCPLSCYSNIIEVIRKQYLYHNFIQG